MLTPPLAAALLGEYWRELRAAAVTLAAIAIAMAAAGALHAVRDFALATAFGFAGIAYGVSAGIPFKPRLRGGLVVMALAYVLDAAMLAREPFIFSIVLVLALAATLAAGGVYGILHAVRNPPRQWRWAVGAAVSALAASVVLVASLPESARWLPGPAFALAILAHAAALYRLARAGRVLEGRVQAPIFVAPGVLGTRA